MSARIPSTYASAPKLSADGRAALACARLEWDRLPKSQQALLLDATSSGGAGLSIYGGRTRERDGLVARGFAVASTSGSTLRVTRLGALVREAGICTTVEVPDVD